MRTFGAIILFIFTFYSINGQDVQEGKLLGKWFDDSLVGSSAFNNTYNEVWGLDVNDHEIAIIGSTAGTHFIDVTDPTNPIEVQFVEGADSGPVIIHRDYHDHNGFLYAVADEGSQSTLQIMDITMLPDSISVIYNSQELIRRSHNIFIDTTTSILYSCISQGFTMPFSPLRLFDISDPYNPRVDTSYTNFDAVQVSQVHDAYVDNNLAYLNCGPAGLAIVDFTERNNVILHSYYGPSDYDQSGYNHSGYPTDDGTYYYFADETWGTDMKAVDVRDLSETSIVQYFGADSDEPFTIPHNQIVSGDYLYGSYYYDGLQVWDISIPSNPRRIMHYNTSSETHKQNYEGAWGVYPFLPSGNILVSDMQEGLFVIESIDKLTVNTNEVNLDKTLQLSPNPAKDIIQVNLPENKNQASFWQIQNIEGRLIMEGAFDNNSPTLDINIGDLASGTYLCQIKSSDNIFTQKFIKK